MAAFNDLAGQTFGNIQVVSLHSRNPARWYCKCAKCGHESVKIGFTITSHRAGCYKCSGMAQRTGYDILSPEYRTWQNMRRRCHNPNAWGYEKYGAKGIQVCQRWQESFQAFLDDLGPRPSPQHSIDRIDPFGNYEPGNCRWLLLPEQLHNRTITLKVTWQGRTQSLSKWAQERGLRYGTVYTRWHAQGIRDPERLFRPVDRVSPRRGVKQPRKVA